MHKNYGIYKQENNIFNLLALVGRREEHFKCLGSYANLQKLVMVLIIPNKTCTNFIDFSKAYLEQKVFDLFISFIFCFSLADQGSIHSLFPIFSTIITSEIGRGRLTQHHPDESGFEYSPSSSQSNSITTTSHWLCQQLLNATHFYI